MKRVVPHLLAALVLLHVFAVTVLAIPSLRASLDRGSWKNPTVQSEFRAWAERLSSWGYEITPTELEERGWRFARSWSRVRETMATPFEPYVRYLGIRQPWVMFVAPHRHPSRVEIAVEENNRWRTIYQARSDEHTWRRQLFDQDRFRSAFFRYGWRRYASAYRQLCDWIAREAAADFPEATRVRVRMMRSKTPPPGKKPVVGVPHHEVILDLDPMR